MMVPVHKHGLKLGWNMVFLKQKKWDLNGFGGVQPAEEQGIQPLNQMLDKKTKMDETLVYSTTFKELQVSKKTPLICSRMRDSCVKCFPHYHIIDFYHVLLVKRSVGTQNGLDCYSIST